MCLFFKFFVCLFFTFVEKQSVTETGVQCKKWTEPHGSSSSSDGVVCDCGVGRGGHHHLVSCCVGSVCGSARERNRGGGGRERKREREKERRKEGRPRRERGESNSSVPLRILFLSEKMPMFCPRDWAKVMAISSAFPYWREGWGEDRNTEREREKEGE